MIRSDRAGDDIMSDDAINGEDWEDGKPLATDKEPTLKTSPSSNGPAFPAT